MEQKLILKVETINKVLSYLSTKPYSEVFELVGEIQREAEMISPQQEEGEPAND